MRFTDVNGVGHWTEVPAETLFEAAILALQTFQKSGFVEGMPGPGSQFEVEIKEPAVRHQVNLGQVMRWLNQQGTSPAEVAKRKRLRELLGTKT